MNLSNYFKLVKPISNEKYNVSVQNQNMDLLDSALHRGDLKDSELETALGNHKNDTTNPHKVDQTQVGLGNVNNTSDINKPVSTAQRAAIDEAYNDAISHADEHINNKENPHEVTMTQLGFPNVENKSSEEIRDELTKGNVTTALGYTPYTPNEVDNKFSALESNIDWKESVDTFDDIETTYPEPIDGWTVNVKDTDYTYRYNGTEWVTISANAIPKATDIVDGLLTKEDHIKYEDAYEKRHTHSNKSVLDGITSAIITSWNSAFSHISDAIRHITSDERTLWNTVSNKVDKITGKGLSTNDYTNDEKSKLSGIATGAEVNQNAFSNVVVGTSTIASDSKTDTLTLAAGTNVTLTPDVTNDKITISSIDTTYSNATQSASGLLSASDKTKLDGVATGANNYTHPSHTSQSLGLFKVEVDSQGHVSDTSAVTKTDITNLGIPATNTTYSVATTSQNGLMSSTDKTKLDGISVSDIGSISANSIVGSRGITATITDGVATVSHTNSITAGTATSTVDFGGSISIPTISYDAQGHITEKDTTTVTLPAKPTPADIGAATTNHTHPYLPLDGGLMTGAINSSKSSGYCLAGNQGQCIINSTAEAGSYTMLAKMNSTHGVFTHGIYGDRYEFHYTHSDIVESGSNDINYNMVLLNEDGNTDFPGIVGALAFSGDLVGNASSATMAYKIGEGNVGSTTKPVYIKDGIPTECTEIVGSGTLVVVQDIEPDTDLVNGMIWIGD